VVALSGAGNADGLISITVTPANPSIVFGQTQQFIATGYFGGGSTQNLTASVLWNSSAPGVATINAAGLANGVSPGSTTITATLVTATPFGPATGVTPGTPIIYSPPASPISGSTTLTVATPPTLAITITDLPVGALANVTVTDPSGQQTLLTSSQVINAIPGTYTITAAPVVVGASTYHATQTTQTATVTFGSRSTVTVDYYNIIPNTTKVLDQTGAQSLTVSSDGTTLTLPLSSPVAAQLAVGNVLASGPTSAVPNGLLVKIVSITSSGSTVTATVAQATLEDAIQQGSFSLNQPVKLAMSAQTANSKAQLHAARAISGKQTRKSAVIRSSNAITDSCSGNANTYELPFDQWVLGQGGLSDNGIGANGRAVLNLSGQLEVCPTLQFSFSIVNSKLVSLTAIASFGDHAQITIQGAVSGSQTNEIDLANITSNVLVVPIGSVPVVVQAQGTPFIGFSGGGTSGFYFVTEQDAQGQAGLTYANGQVTPVSSATSTATYGANSLDGSIDVKGYAGIKIGLLLYGVLCPNVAPDAFLDWTVPTGGNPWWELTGGFEANVGVDLKIIGETEASLSTPDLTLYETTLASASGPFSVPAASPILTTVSPTTAPAGSPDMILSLTGDNFVPDSVVYFNGTALTTTFNDPSDLAAVLPAAELMTPGPYPVSVSNPDTAGAISPATIFSVTGTLLPTVSALTINPTNVNAGGTTTGTVTLTGAAPSGGSVVDLTSGNPSILPVPTSVTVQTGMTTATFTVTAAASVTASTPVLVTATYNNSSQTATVIVNPQGAVAGLSFSPTSILPGNSTTGTVTLNDAAPTGGVNVTLTSNNSSALPVPATVTVPAGSTTATFTATAPSSLSSTAAATITATYDGSSLNATVTVIVVSYSVLYSFMGSTYLGPDGGFPYGSLVQDSAGNLYGTTSYGGVGAGTVFMVDPAGDETVLHRFNGGATYDGGTSYDGIHPQAGLLRDEAGNLYGTTEYGGLTIGNGPCDGEGCGTVFMIDTTGQETVLYSFAGLPDGAYPYAGLVRDAAGNLYGTTTYGGLLFCNENNNIPGCGTVFMIDTTGQETVLYSFAGPPDGFFPYAGLVRDAAGNLYGTTTYGGLLSCNENANIPGCGTVFMIDTTGKESVLYSFAGPPDGAYPYAGLVRDAAGNLYGTTWGGGIQCLGYSSGCGTVFMIDTTGKESVLYSFAGPPDGAHPYGGLVRDSMGNLYGTTTEGGTGGVIFMIDTTGKETVLHNFDGANCISSAPCDGFGPYDGLIQDAAGNLYGTTAVGGASGVYGTVFRLSGVPPAPK